MLHPILRASLILVAAASSAAGVRAQVPGPAQLAQPLEFREFSLPFTGHNYAYFNFVALSKDNTLLAAAAESSIVVWNMQTEKIVSQMQLPRKQYSINLVFSDDAKTLISNGSHDWMIRFWDVKTGRQLRERPHANAPKTPDDEDEPKGKSENPFRNFFEGFSPDGRLMAIVNNSNLEIVDTATGKKKFDLEGHSSWRGNAAFSPDGSRIAVGSSYIPVFKVFSAEDGKLIQTIGKVNKSGPSEGFSYIGLSHGGKYVFGQTSDENRTTRHSFFGVDDGLEVHRVPEAWALNFALSPDGRLLLHTRSNKLTMIDTWSDREVVSKEVAVPTDLFPGRMHISQDGKFLAVLAHKNNKDPNVVLVTRFPRLTDPVIPEKLSDADLEDLWTGFSGNNLFRERFVSDVFRKRPAQAIAFLAERIEPTPAADRRRVDEILKDLDDGDFKKRDAATKTLRANVLQFEPLLRETAKSGPEGEVRNRVTLVLNEGAKAPLPATMQGELRGVELLAGLPDPAARKLLEQIAAGAAGSRLTVEAGKALERK